MKKYLLLCITVAVTFILLPVSTAQASHKLKPPKNFSYSQNITTQRLVASFVKAKGAKKTVVKLKQGSTVLASKKVKGTTAKFPESLVTHGEQYTFRYRHLKTRLHRASNWRKLIFTFEDKDFDDDFIDNTTDTDDDNDGILDEVDEFDTDHDNDGTPDYSDDDDDNDLYDDVDDDYPYDHDNDGIDDIDDPDDDNDGIPDVDEADGQQFDFDNDGIPDNEDPDYIDLITPDPETFTVNITSSGLDDGDITITVNDYVQWRNQHTGVDHTIQASDDSWSSGPLFFGESYTKQFTEAGEYEYYDPSFSDSFAGTITVQE